MATGKKAKDIFTKTTKKPDIGLEVAPHIQPCKRGIGTLSSRDRSEGGWCRTGVLPLSPESLTGGMRRSIGRSGGGSPL